MYTQQAKPKEHQSQSCADAVAQKMSVREKGIELVDNRGKSIVQNKLKEHPNKTTLVNPVTQLMFKGFKASIFGNEVPEGVEEYKVLGGGYGVGYKKSNQTVYLYGSNGIIAHVNIQTHGEDSNISLHTGTDSGTEGGQGHMTAMFPVALKVVARYFGDYPGIDMAPALGAATKGLISQLARLRQQVEPPTPRKRFGDSRMFMASRFISLSDELRERRKRKEESGKKQRPEAQEWDAETMMETAHELNALREMEAANPLGIDIVGLNGKFNERLVGKNSPYLNGGAFAWHESSTKQGQGMLQLKIPMEAVKLFAKSV
ncbi:hypothetical protein P8625_00720 [Tenacibaculum tangerinum]|uniref:Uncharacterized protein n=1 Tax=Tenacibaculum tangerinum TaxID=3038772 RepID=A0ABY8L696_9FLAO|nr:hypothetical protein [Tenacibaculum tangerinum]WGH75718.1 hypothetical protein P8625_00720 [Tenacibaculum tangerinum]